MFPDFKTGFAPVDAYAVVNGATATEGSIAVMVSGGSVKDGADEASVKVLGLFREIGLDGKAKVEVGCYQLANSSTSALARTDRGAIVYLEDKDTVRKTAGAHSVIAGLLVDVDDGGAWVDMTPQGLAAARAAAVTGFVQAATQADASDITNSTGGAASSTHVVVAPAASDYTAAELKANFATLAAEHNALNAVVKGLVDKLQAAGLMA